MNKISKANMQKFEELKQKAMNALEELRDELSEIADHVDSTYYDRSEKWQESERGDAYQDWHSQIEEKIQEIESVLDEVESIEFEEIEQPEI